MSFSAGRTCTGDDNLADCPRQSAPAVFAFALFMLVSNILLINLLVSMFGYTFAKVHEGSTQLWAYLRYQLVEEYQHASSIPPPFNIFYFIYAFVVYFYRSISKECNTDYEEKDFSTGFGQLFFITKLCKKLGNLCTISKLLT